MEIRTITAPFTEEVLASLKVGDIVNVSGTIFAGRDAVLPRLVEKLENGTFGETGIDLQGGVIFHTAVSRAGVGPTSSNKAELEGTMPQLTEAGIRMFLGKGELKKETIEMFGRYNAVYAVIPPVTALLGSKTSEIRVLQFSELGMEALHLIKADKYPAIIAGAQGRSIYE